ncbi:DUF2283 domain-containing protein [Rhodopseudomonas palustris]|uniref:DUF2283 domain-containing protein n=1 Tax=Thiospirillum jenense TaxID=1653858 RepID=A0A839HC91_9GAMM|nr:DUF2283 domain-containing protein [Thiospirillum jenense]MBB1089716.1 DUF2283 domain-containing protein [Rhodopseudomonas palustris]MBB1124817.1 DUF2283 domain-containing protein [Thiospirillum jenense]
MKITYHEADDILLIEFSTLPIVRDESVNWNINVGYTVEGLGELTILEARQCGFYPFEIERVQAAA